jgi:hypothetical protein
VKSDGLFWHRLLVLAAMTNLACALLLALVVFNGN